MNSEMDRLGKARDRTENWQRWGTYLPERQWATRRETPDFAADPWASFPFDTAQYRAYRWGEDGLLGWTDRECRLCFSTTLWNGKDAQLKERFFGLTNTEGNHGEDVKELYYYLDATPTHSYARALYKYPQARFPYEQIREQSKNRSAADLEYELLDTGVFDDNKYFDIVVEYAKRDCEDILIRLTLANQCSQPAELTVLPTLTFRNDWAWPPIEGSKKIKPCLRREQASSFIATHESLGEFHLTQVLAENSPPSEELLITENETNQSRLDSGGGSLDGSKDGFKDAFDAHIVRGEQSAVASRLEGTKGCIVYRLQLAAHGQPGSIVTIALQLRRTDDQPRGVLSYQDFQACFEQRIREADEFYTTCIPQAAPDEEKRICRQAYAGLLWSKQFYYYVAEDWLHSDQPQAAPDNDQSGNKSWRHLFCKDVLSIPDKWEYPWFAAWDMAFHMFPMSAIDPAFAKAQLLLLLREWYMHPNGQLPAYEYGFDDMNPPVHAWAVWHVYKLTQSSNGKDLDFLERCFQKLMLNFTWWVNRVDASGRNLFGGGFLGLDNIGVFDRSKNLPPGSTLDQADGTAWMGLYCSYMLQIAMELAEVRPAYEDMASKFLEHYFLLIDAINSEQSGLWNEEDGFYFDRLRLADGTQKAMKIRSFVGIVPILAICLISEKQSEALHGFRKRAEWLRQHKPRLAEYVGVADSDDKPFRGIILALVPKARLERMLRCILDESEFLSPFGIRSLSRRHLDQPFEIEVEGTVHGVKYEPGYSADGMFGGNSNWRGPLWLPINLLLGVALERYYIAYGDSFRVECPSGSGNLRNMREIAEELTRRQINLFLPDEHGRRPCHGDEQRYAKDPAWRELLLFSEYFSGEDGRGLGASHQTGWTATIASAIRWAYMDDRERIEGQ